ncbi:PEGA domain-containing protein [Candidatus Poribacteria bacterium]|nr:PEGA domain-containing protein [Candidatus Poribacteria bacterium]
MKKRNISSSLKIVLAILIGLIGVTVCHAEPVEIHGTVTAVEEETMTIDLGEPQKLMPGIRGEVYYEISIGDATKPILIGEFEVTAVGESESRARLLNRRGEIRPGRLVRLTLDIPPGVGSLKTFSEPAGAQVALDDKDVGQTKPEGLVLESIPSGLHTVRLTRQFYRPTVRTVIVLPEAMTTLKVNLEQNWGNLGVTSDPPGAEVQVEEGNTKGHEEHKARTPYTFEHLPAGTYEVNAQAEGYYTGLGLLFPI